MLLISQITKCGNYSVADQNVSLLLSTSVLLFDYIRQLSKSKSDWRWQLTASGRFAHRKAYVESMAMQHSLRIVHYEELIDFRYENGVGVRGHIFVLQKQLKSNEL